MTLQDCAGVHAFCPTGTSLWGLLVSLFTGPTRMCVRRAEMQNAVLPKNESWDNFINWELSDYHAFQTLNWRWNAVWPYGPKDPNKIEGSAKNVQLVLHLSSPCEAVHVGYLRAKELVWAFCRFRRLLFWLCCSLWHAHGCVPDLHDSWGSFCDELWWCAQ